MVETVPSDTSDDEPLAMSKTNIDHASKVKVQVKRIKKSNFPDAAISSSDNDDDDDDASDDEPLKTKNKSIQNSKKILNIEKPIGSHKLSPKKNSKVSSKQPNKDDLSCCDSSSDDEPLQKSIKILEMRKTENKKIQPLNDTVSSVSSSEDSSCDDEPLTKKTKENDCIDDKNDSKKVSENDKQQLPTKLEIEDTTVLCKEGEESEVRKSDTSINSDTDGEIKTKPTTEQSNKKKRKRSGSSSEEKLNKKAKLSKKVSTKLSNLMRYVRACGVHVGNYAKIFEGCNSMKSKEEKLTNMLKDLGIKGRPSLSQCKKIRLKREEEREVAELDVGNIMSGNRRSQSKSAILSAQKENEPPTSRKYVFGSLSDLDSERSEDEGVKCESLDTNKAKKKRIISDSEDEVDE